MKAFVIVTLLALAACAAEPPASPNGGFSQLLDNGGMGIVQSRNSLPRGAP